MTKEDGAVNIGQKTVEEVEEFQYLGSIISKIGNTCADIKERISKTRHAFMLLRPVWHTTSVSLKTKLSIFSSNVISVLLYGSETWRLTAMLINKIQVFVYKCLRGILSIRWPEKIRNEDLWQQTGQEPIEAEIKKRSWRWIGHTEENTEASPKLRWSGTHRGNRKEGAPHTAGGDHAQQS